MSKISNINPSLAIIWFIITTILYGIFKYFVGLKKTFGEDSDPTNLKLLLYGYLLFTILSELFINLDLTKKMCISPQFSTAIFITVVPWSLIFTTIMVLLQMFPGWLAPFSNTFGYGLTIIMGIKNLINRIIDVDDTPDANNPQTNNSNSKSKFVKSALQYITTDKGILINEITQENFETFWKNMQPIFRKEAKNDDVLKMQLYNLVRVKTITSEVIWYILTGVLIVSISYNNILNTNCKKNIQDIKQSSIEYEKIRAKENSEKIKTTRPYSD